MKYSSKMIQTIYIDGEPHEPVPNMSYSNRSGQLNVTCSYFRNLLTDALVSIEIRTEIVGPFMTEEGDRK